MKTLSREGIQRMIDGQGASSGGGGGIQSLAGYATQAWTEENYLSKPYFNQLFTVHTRTTTTVVDDQGEPVGDPVITYGTLAPNALPGTTETTDEETGYVTTVATVITSIEAKFGFWSQSFISALGQGSGGGGGATALTDLVDVAISSVENGQVLMYDSTLSKWVNGTVQSGNYLPLTGGTMANTNLVTNMNADLLDGLNGADYLSRHNVDNDYDTTPGQKIITVTTGSTIVSEHQWGSLIQWGNSNKTPGTADLGTWYNQLIGMTNDRLYFRTRTNGGDWTTVKKIAFISDFSSWALASTKPSYAFSELTSHPTTLSGYGITDAYINSGTIYLGGNSITPLTSFTETDPTVPAWAKASTKPSYAFSELTGSVAFSQLPTMYWANVAVSSQSSVDTEPQFKNLRLKSSTSNMGSYLRFGDGDYAYIAEIPEDDSLTYHVATSDKHIFNVGSYDRLHVTSAGISVLGSIDFFYNGASSYTSRITEDASGRIYLNAGNGVRIGNGVLIWDSTNNALKIQKNDGTAANFYATGGVSALGLNSGGGSGSIGNLTINTYLTCNGKASFDDDIFINVGGTLMTLDTGVCVQLGILS